MTRGEKRVRVAMLRQIQLLKQRDWRDSQDEDVRKRKLWQQRSLLTNYNETVDTSLQQGNDCVPREMVTRIRRFARISNTFLNFKDCEIFKIKGVLELILKSKSSVLLLLQRAHISITDIVILLNV